MTSTADPPPEVLAPTSEPPRGGMRRPAHSPRWAGGLALAIGLLFAAPLGFLLVRSLFGGTYLEVLAGADLLRPTGNTLLLAGSVSAATATIGTGAAWLVTRSDIPLPRLWRSLLPLPLVIPSFIGAFALIAAFAPGGIVASWFDALGVSRVPQVRGFWGAFAVLTLLTYPYVYLPVAARLSQLPPSPEEAARLLGRRPRTAFREVVLPQLRPSILAGTLLVFLYTVSDFGAVELMRFETLTRAIFLEFGSLDLATALALSLNLGILALLVVVLERTVARGAPPRTSVRTVHGLTIPLRRWRAPATGALVTLVTLALAAPLGVLGFWAVRGLFQDTVRASALVNDLSDLVAPAWNTARVSLVAAVVSVVVVLPIAWLTVRYRSRVAGVANALVVTGFALPGLAIALALVYWSLRVAGLGSGSLGLLLFAYVVHFGAQSLRAAEIAVASVPPRLDDAARALGAGPVRRFATVQLPLMGPGLLAGGGLVLLSTMKELPATLLLAPAGFQTLATRIWQSTADAFLADAAIASLVLVALSGVLTWVLVVRRSETL